MRQMAPETHLQLGVSFSHYSHWEWQSYEDTVTRKLWIDTGLCGKGGWNLNIVLAFSKRGWTSIIVQPTDKSAEPYWGL